MVRLGRIIDVNHLVKDRFRIRQVQGIHQQRPSIHKLFDEIPRVIPLGRLSVLGHDDGPGFFGMPRPVSDNRQPLQRSLGGEECARRIRGRI